MKQRFKKALSLLLTLAMVIGIAPMSLADDAKAAGKAAVTQPYTIEVQADKASIQVGGDVTVAVTAKGGTYVGAACKLGYESDKFTVKSAPDGWEAKGENSYGYYNVIDSGFYPEDTVLGDFTFTAKDQKSEATGSFTLSDTYMTGEWEDGWSTDAAQQVPNNGSVDVQITLAPAYEVEIVKDYVAGYSLVLVYTDKETGAYAYDGEAMYDVTNAGYLYKGTRYARVYGLVVNGRDADPGKVAGAAEPAVRLAYSTDVNGSNKTDLNDAVAVVAVYNANEMYMRAMHMDIVLKSDVNKDKKVNVDDFSLIKAKYMSNTRQFMLYDGASAAPVLMDAHYDETDTVSKRTYTEIARAAGDFRQDVAMVTGAIDYQVIQQLFEDSDVLQAARLDAADQSRVPALIHEAPQGTTCQNAVIVGAIGESALIDGMIAAGKLDEAKPITGQWEAYVIKEVTNPIPGVENALVIAGSDARGTIYGLYTISEEIGVSPWYWYSDVAVDTKSEIRVDYTAALVDNGPDVKYRGIFFNDEEHATDWANAKFTTDGKAPGVNYYRRTFEVLLRLKANTLWPSMHECSVAFNTDVDENGIPVNGKEAGKYGIIMGSSHCEQMLRNNVGEWWNWKLEKDANGNYKNKQYFNEFGGTNPPGGFANDDRMYDYTINPQALLAYWRARLEKSKDFEGIYVLGLRAMHDGEFYHRDLKNFPGANDTERKVNALKEIINEQRKVIAEVYGLENVNKIPQCLIPYREMGGFYNAGINEMMLWDGSEDFNGDGVTNELDDCSGITLMWAEDNENFLRQVPTDTERERPGGSGVYYHNSYFARPGWMSYLWINSTQMNVMSEEMQRAYDAGSRAYWILNVGDLKPGEILMESFLDMAWDVNSWDDKTAKPHLREVAKRDFALSDADAQTVAETMDEFYQLIGIKKPEFYSTLYTAFGADCGQFSATANGDEAMLWVARCTAMCDTLGGIYEKLPERYKTAFYQQIYYNAMVVQEAAEHWMYYRKHQLANDQGRMGSSYVYETLSKEARDRIFAHIDEFNGQNDGKWSKMMNIYHVGNDDDGRNDNEVLQDRQYSTLKDTGTTGLGTVCENQTAAGNGILRFHSLAPNDQRFFDVFSKGAAQEHWVAETSADWITLSRTFGATSTEQRVIVTVDWSKVTGTQNGTISVYPSDASGEKTNVALDTFTVTATKSTVTYGDNKGYIEANGYVTIEAEHYTQNIPGTDNSWELIKNSAPHGDTMKSLPDVDSHTEDWDNAAKLVYRVYFDKAGTYTLTADRLPTLNEGRTAEGVKRTINAAIGVNGAQPTSNTILVGKSDYLEPMAQRDPWHYNIQHMHEAVTIKITVNQGWNEIAVYRSDSAFVLDRITIETIKGAIPTSWTGPNESPNNIAPAPAAAVGALPESALDSYQILNITQDDTIQVPYPGVLSATVNSPAVSVDAAEKDRITITGKRVGNAVVSVRSTTGAGVFQVRVSVRPDAGAGLYLEENNQVVIDATDVLAGNSSAVRKADSTNDHNWELSSTGMAALPDIGSQWSNSADVPNAPSVTYAVHITNAGTYYVFLNMSSPNNAADSYHISIDGVNVFNGNAAELFGENRWHSGGTEIPLTAGKHEVTVHAREDGFVLNQVVLTTNKDAQFSGYLTPSKNALPAGTIFFKQPDDVELKADGEGTEIALSVSAGNNAALTITAESSNTDVATACVAAGKLIVTGRSTGTTAITVTASAQDCESVVRTFEVTCISAVDSNPINRSLLEKASAKRDYLSQYSYPLGDNKVGCYSQDRYTELTDVLTAVETLARREVLTVERANTEWAKVTAVQTALDASLCLTGRGVTYNAYRDFGDDEVGKYPYGMKQVRYTDDSTVTVVHEGEDQFLRVNTKTSTAERPSANLFFPYAIPVEKVDGQRVVIECRVRMTEGASYANFCLPQNETRDLNGNPADSTPHAMTVAFDQTAGQMFKVANADAGLGSVQNPLKCEYNTWYTIKIVADMTAQTYTVAINDEVLPGTYVFRNPTDRLIGQIFGLDERPNGLVDFDDFRVYVEDVT